MDLGRERFPSKFRQPSKFPWTRWFALYYRFAYLDGTWVRVSRNNAQYNGGESTPANVYLEKSIVVAWRVNRVSSSGFLVLYIAKCQFETAFDMYIFVRIVLSSRRAYFIINAQVSFDFYLSIRIDFREDFFIASKMKVDQKSKHLDQTLENFVKINFYLNPTETQQQSSNNPQNSIIRDIRSIQQTQTSSNANKPLQTLPNSYHTLHNLILNGIIPSYVYQTSSNLFKPLQKIDRANTPSNRM